MRSTLKPVLVGCLLLVACSDDNDPRDVFETEVAPILEMRCAALVCHGAGSADAEATVADTFHLRIDGEGRLTDLAEARAATRQYIDTLEDPAFSSLLRKPLPAVYGGQTHAGGDNFTSPADPAYRTLARWITLERSGGEDPWPATLDERERYFADVVQPQLFQRGCGLANCHSPEAFPPFRLQPGLPPAVADESGVPSPLFDVSTTRENYQHARTFLSLDGVPTMSRLLRKALPIEGGGIAHRVGNRGFLDGPTDPLFTAIVDWAELERDEVLGRQAPVWPGELVFVRGPVEPASPFDADRFVPGSDLWLRDLDTDAERNLTAELHGRDADVRDPAVSPDGRLVAFAMRRQSDAGHVLFEMALDSGRTEQLTQGGSDVTPVYGGDGWIYFASNRHGVLAERRDALDLDLFRIPSGGGDIERLTFTPAPEIEPALFSIGPMAGYLVFAYRRAIDDRDRTVGFSFPLDRHVDYHIHFGLTPEQTLFYQSRELPDGRAAVIVGDPANAWEGGQIALIDRNLGPALLGAGDPDTASVVGYADTLRTLDPDTLASGTSPGGVYRDPAPLPDGSILAAWAPGPFDLGDGERDIDYGIVRLVIEETDGSCTGAECSPRIAEREVWVDEVGLSDHSPEPVMPVWRERDAHDSLDPDDPTLFSMIDIAVNDGVMNDLYPTGEKRFRDDVRFVRFVEALPAAPGDAAPGLSRHAPARILGEVAVEDDFSLYLEVPPETPFRTQLLDESRMNIGHQHNRWLFAWRGQHFSQSTHRNLYDQSCGGCHGSASGLPEQTLASPDTTTRATLTLARFDGRNPRRPLEPGVLGESTQIEVDFVDDVAPILDAHCVSCHSGDAPDGELDLGAGGDGAFSDAYTALLSGAWVDVSGYTARSSPVIELVTGRRLDARRDFSSHPELELSDDEQLTLVRWIEIGAPYEVSAP